MQKHEELGDNVQKAATEMVSDLSPFDVNDTNVEAYEEKIEKHEIVSYSLAMKIYRLKNDVKARKLKRKPELLEEDLISVLQSQDVEDLTESFFQESLQDFAQGRPET